MSLRNGDREDKGTVVALHPAWREALSPKPFGLA